MSLSAIIAAMAGIMTAVVAWRVLRGSPQLSSPVIPVCVGLLSFIGLQRLPEGVVATIMSCYVALALAILCLLLWITFQKIRQSQVARSLSHLVKKSSSSIRQGQRLRPKAPAQSSQR